MESPCQSQQYHVSYVIKCADTINNFGNYKKVNYNNYTFTKKKKHKTQNTKKQNKFVILQFCLYDKWKQFYQNIFLDGEQSFFSRSDGR